MSKPKGKRGGRAKKPFPKDEGKFQGSKKRPRANSSRNQDIDKEPDRGTSNAPEWWMSVGQLATESTNISTFNAAGAPELSPVYTKAEWTPSGIMRLDYIPYFGVVNDVTHPINIAAKQIYDWVNSKNSRNPSYDPVDIFMYVVAVANAWSLHSFVRRICGMYGTFSSTNRYWWRAVLQSMDIAPIDTDNDITAWRNLANRMAIQLNRLPVPNDIAYFNRVIMMNEAVYMDAQSQKASMYYFCPAAVMQYTIGDGSAGMQLKNHPLPWFDVDSLNGGNPVTPAKVESTFNSIVNSLFNDTDVNTIGSDIIKAYGIENCFKLPQIDSTYAILPVYDPIVNVQVHNARVAYTIGNQIITNPYELIQDMDHNCIKSKFDIRTDVNEPDHMLVATDVRAGREIALDFPIDAPDNNLVMEATRLTWYAQENAITHVKEVNACVDLLVKDRCFTFVRNAASNAWELHELDKCIYVGFEEQFGPEDMATSVGKIATAAKFACAPINYVAVMEGVQTFASPTYMDITSDVTNFTTVSRETLRRMNEAAIYSIFMPTKLAKQ